MKQVLHNKRKYGWKDIAKMFMIFIGHYFFFAFYVAIILLIRYSWSDDFLPKLDNKTWLVYYPVTIAPALSATLHIAYAEKGSPWLRFTMWLHAMFNIIIVPVIALI